MTLRTPSALIGGVVVAALAAGPAVATPQTPVRATSQQGSAADPTPEEAAAGYLVRELASGGHHFSVDFGGTLYPDHGVTADAVLALDAVGAGQTEAAAATSYLAGTVGAYIGTDGETYAGATAKLLNVVIAQQGDPTAFGGVDLLARLAATEKPSGQFADISAYGDNSNLFGQSLAIMALKRAGSGPSAASVAFLRAQQCSDGGFRLDFTTTPCASDPDATALAVQALIAVGGGSDTDANQGLDYLVGKQQASGGVGGAGPTASPNANSTGLAGQAFLAGGRPAQARLANTYIAGLQYGCSFPAALRGGIAYDRAAYDAQVAAGASATTADQDRRSTSQAALSLAGTPLFAVTKAGAAADAPSLVCPAPPDSAGTFQPVSPVRLLDTRAIAKIGANSTVDVQVTGRGGVPAVAGVDAVVVNVTAVKPTAGGYATVWPQGTSRPTTSNLNFRAGEWALANLVVVKVGATGAISVHNAANGATHYLVDVVGFYKKSGQSAGSKFTPQSPKRILDTRPGAPVAANAERLLTVRGGTTGVPVDATGVVMNVTAANTTAEGYLTVYPNGQSRPVTSNINWAGPTAAIPNLVYSRVGANGQVRIYNSAGTVDVLADVVGWFGPTGKFVYHPLAPKRVVDTRSGLGAPARQLRANETVKVDLASASTGVADTATAVVAQTTATRTTATSYLSVWPGVGQPTGSSLNWTTGRTVSNLVSTQVGTGGVAGLYNNLGLTDVVMDVAGWYGP
jgi:hypothetical protein